MVRRRRRGKKHSRGREKKRKKQRFSSSSSFSPPSGFRLPCRTLGLSCRRLRHQLSRQAGAAHFKARHRPPGPGSCIQNNCGSNASEKKRKRENQRRSRANASYPLGMERILNDCSVYFPKREFLFCCFLFFCHVSLILSPDREVAAAARRGPYQRQVILSQLPRGCGAAEVTDLPPQ